MTISSSLNAGVSGLAANASKLATIADNISNSKTYGYKRADVEFSSLALTPREGTYTAGGVRANSFRMVDSQGSLTVTSNSLDIAVGGIGMLPVTPIASLQSGTDIELQMVTTGSFQPDSDGIVRTTSGLVLLGWPADADGNIPAQPRDAATGLQAVEVTYNQFAANRTSEIELGANLPATATQAGAPGTPYVITVEYYDNLGAPQTMDATLTPQVPGAGSSNTWDMVVTDNDNGPTVVADFTIQFDAAPGTGGSILTVTPNGAGTYDPVTGLITTAVNSGPMTIEVGIPGASTHLTQLSGSFAPTGVSKNGSPVGSLIAVDLDEGGILHALYDTGFSRPIYQIPLASVANMNGMATLDNQAFGVTPDSGPFYLWDAGDGPTGQTIGYAREESTTDIAGELTALIQTQRAYASNAKVIQTVDEMLQETTNIKR